MRRIYNIVEGMGSIGFARFALLRASLRRKEGDVILRLYGTAKAVP